MSYTVFPIGTSRETLTELYQWCANTYKKEVINEGVILVIIENGFYYRAISLDDGRVYHMNHHDYYHCTRDVA